MDINILNGSIPNNVLQQIPSVMDKFQINTPLRLCHFLAQCGHESWSFTAVRENLNYSSKALMATFKKLFPTEDIAKQYEFKPEKIGNLVYSNRMGNGPESSGDGYKYRGRWYIQLTGKINYASFSKSVEDDVLGNPDLVATKYPLLSAAWFWNSRRLNSYADIGASELEITAITKKINGGTNGLLNRIARFNKLYALFQ